jgi:hypothetical protein
MSKLGKCLVFCLKYPAEMDQLCWDPRETGEEPRVRGLKDRDKVLAMVKRVGDQANREAVAFLEVCAGRIEPHLESIATARRYGRSLEQTWQVQWQLLPKKHPDWRPFYVSVYVGTHPPEVGAGIWTRGGRRAEDKLAKILGQRVKARSSDWQQSPGNIALARIEVPIPDAPGVFDVDQEPLVALVCTALTFDAADVKAIAAIAIRSSE